MPKGVPLTDEEQARRRQEVFNASVHLFLEKGFSETSMREIAAAAGIGKATLYDNSGCPSRTFICDSRIEAQRLVLLSQQRIQAARHAYQDMLRHLIEDGIREGAFRPVDPLLATRLLLTMVTPVVFTTRPSGSHQQMMDEALGIFFRGVEAQLSFLLTGATVGRSSCRGGRKCPGDMCFH